MSEPDYIGELDALRDLRAAVLRLELLSSGDCLTTPRVKERLKQLQLRLKPLYVLARKAELELPDAVVGRRVVPAPQVDLEDAIARTQR